MICAVAKQSQYIGIICLILLCGFAQPTIAAPTQEAQAYLNQAIDLIRKNHRKSAQADWPKITQNAQENIADAKKPADTYRAIRGILAALNEPHSFLIDPASASNLAGNGNNAQPIAANKLKTPTWKLEARRFGVVTLPSLVMFGDGEWQKGLDYMNATRNGLIQMDKDKICGWVIDLRQNEGGNMWPMLWGLDPILGPSPFGAFVTPDGKTEKWVRAQDQIFPTSETLPETVPNFRLKHEKAPVAVLIGPSTASSGEMTAIAFIGRDNVRLFGNPSYGFSSANTTHQLSDGAFLLLTGASVTNRLGVEYAGPIIPDEQVADKDAMPVAMKWLKKRC
jgi:carboxyl-terminal processing protease